jgi:hypothetical protein
VEDLLVEIVCTSPAVRFIVLDQAARQGQESLHALRLQPVSAAQARFQQGDNSL